MNINPDEYKKLMAEFEYLHFFFCQVDFGPAHSDVVQIINEAFEMKVGKPVPEDYKLT